jgi:hypothetical protein
MPRDRQQTGGDRTVRMSREVVRMGVLSFWVDVRHEVMGAT